MRRQFLGLMGLVVVMSCQDSSPGGRSPLAPSQDASFLISDGRSGGNPETFWGTPLAQNAQAGDPNYDVGASHALLQPYLRVCELALNTEPPLGVCPTDVTQLVTGSATGLLMTYNSGNENYTAGLQTKQLNKAKNYRLEVWGVAFITAAERAALDPRWLFTVRDIGNSPSVSACVVTQAFCFIKYGQSVPVKVRIEEFVFCPNDRNCGMQFVFAGSAANLQATLPTGSAAPTAQFFIPGQAGTNFALAFEPCTALEDAAVNAAADNPLFGPCLKTVSKFTGLIGTPAIISLCSTLDATPFGLSEDQEEQLALHHFSGNSIQALPEAWQCASPTSGVASAKPRGLLQYARALGDRLVRWAAPKPLFASMIDRGGGGADPLMGTVYKLGLPTKLEFVVAADSDQTGKAGDPIVLSVKATDLFGAPVAGARVHWAALPIGTEGATVQGTVPPGPTLTNSLGIAQITATLAPTKGFNVFTGGGRGLADARTSGCTLLPSTPSSCNGPRAMFDSFIPLHSEFQPETGQELGPEVPVALPIGTRLKFTVYGRGPSQ